MTARRILLIEPDQVLGQAYSTALSSCAFEVNHVHNAQAAVIAADNNCPDLVICEIQLISHSGIEFLYEFRSYPDWQHVPVIIFSVVPFTEFSGSQQGLAKDLGVSKYLYKPNTSLKHLMRTINEFITV